MNCAKWLLIGGTMATLAVSGSPALAAVIADYRVDYLQGTENGQTRVERSADGWDYMWNATGAIGTAASNYASLKASGTTYNFDGGSPLPRAYPAGWVLLNSTGGHPGTGINQGSPAQGADRFAIAAYEVQAGEAGLVQITNGTLGVGSFSSGGVELRVYVNDTPVTRFVQPGGSSGTGAGAFNVALGQLSAGDKVYVAIGPNAHEGSDSFSLGYRLETVTDTASVFWGPGGSGTWDTSTAQWTRGVYNSGADVAWSNAENKAAYFTGSGGTVTLGSAITARALSFDAAYTLAGTGALTLTGAGTGGPGAATVQVINNADTVTISAPIASAAGLSKIGPGTLTLTGTTSITGGELSAAGGTLRLAGSSSTTVAGNVNVGRNWDVSGGNQGALVIQDTATLTAGHLRVGDGTSVSGTVTQSGGAVTVTGTFRLGHYPSQTSTYTLSNGTLSLTGTPTGTVNPSGAAEQPGILYIGIDGTGNFQQSGGTASAHGIVLDGRGHTAGSDTFTLTGGTFTVGPSGITSGSLNVNEAYQINLGGGTLGASGNWASSRRMTLTGTGGNTIFDTGGHTLTLSGALSGSGGVNKIGAGTLNLEGGGSYSTLNVAAGDATLGAPSATTTLTGGLQVGNAHTAGGGSATLDIVDGSLTAAWIQLGNTPGTSITATINQSGGSVRTTGVVAEDAGFRLGHYPASTTFYNLSGGELVVDNDRYFVCAVDGTGTFHQTGGVATATRVVVNARANGLGSGTFTLEGGTFNVGSGGIVNDAGPAAVNLGGMGGTLRATAGWSSTLPMTLSGTGANAIRIDTNGNAIGLSGVLSGEGGLHKAGEGTLTLTNANTYTGGTTVDAGTLMLGTGGAVGTIRGTLTVNSGATVNHAVGHTFGYTAGQSVNVLNIVGGTVGGADFSNHFWNSFQLNMTGGTLYLGGTFNEFLSPTITVNASAETARILPVTDTAVLRLRNGTSAVFDVADGPQAVDLLVDVPIVPQTTSGITKTGAGTMVLTKVNTYNGTTAINGGTLTVSGNGAITQTGTLRNGGGGATLNVQDNASINVVSTMVFGDAGGGTSITINQSGGSVSNQGTTNNPAGNSVSNRWGHWPGGTTTYNLTGGTLNLLGAPLYLSWDGAATLNIQGGTANILGINMGYGTRSSVSSINLSSGRLNIGAAGIVTGGTANKSINLGGATLGALANWSSSLPMTLTGIGGDAAIDTNGHTINLSGILSGSGGLTKAGEGTLVLGGNNSYRGDTNISAGALLVNGSLHADSAVTVQSGGTLGGTGTIGGPASILSGGTLATGTSVGTLTFGSDLTLAGGAVWDWEFIDSTAGNYDQAVGINDAKLILPTDGTTPITLNIFGDAGGHWVNWYDEFTIFDGAVEHFDAGLFDLVNHSDWTRVWRIFSGGQD
ncbi:MAG: autotransporter-associated beta strand repeat-containing protein, partial [Thermoguttaceae bacterium]|nr:autotransporter-associated beta strand repeat-containing protein [Thermoguttaceae bacterium]